MAVHSSSPPILLPLSVRRSSRAVRMVILYCRRITHVQIVREFTPNVIEPSFGIGRILYSLLEHSYWRREQDLARGVSPSVLVVTSKSLNQIIIRRFFLSPPALHPQKSCFARSVPTLRSPRSSRRFVRLIPPSYNLTLTPSLHVATKLRAAGISARVDDSGATIGKRYSRNDELGTPYGITIDFACKSNIYACMGSRSLLWM